jgi:hypothetical protein
MKTPTTDTERPKLLKNLQQPPSERDERADRPCMGTALHLQLPPASIVNLPEARDLAMDLILWCAQLKVDRQGAVVQCDRRLRQFRTALSFRATALVVEVLGARASGQLPVAGLVDERLSGC